MALKFFDGFDSLVTTLIGRKWPNSTISNSTLTTGRLGVGQALSVLGSSVELLTPSFSSHATWTIGFAFQNVSLTGTANTILEIRDTSAAQVDLRFNAVTGILSVTRGGTTLGTGTKQLFSGNWYYVELKVTVNNTTGAVDLKVNEISDIALTSQNTQTSGNATANRLAFLGPTTGSYLLDDVYVNDGSGSTQTGFLGDMKVEILQPGVEGNTTGWTAVPSTARNHTAVAEFDSSYIQASSTSTKDTYNFNNLKTITSGVVAVAVNVFARNTDATQHTLTGVIRSAGADTDHGTPVALTDTALQSLQFISVQDPNNGSAQDWSVSTVNSSEYGVKKTA